MKQKTEPDPEIKIYHNPQCSKSCSTLDTLHEKGINPQIIDYLNHPPSKEELLEILAMLNYKPLALIRTNEPLFQQKYEGHTYTDEQWIDIMLQHPELIERPIVVANGKAIIARPLEKLYSLLQ